MKNNIKIIASLAITGIFSSSQACMITLTNDGSEKVLVCNKNDNEVFELNKGKSRRFGDPEKHANFEVYTKRPKVHTFELSYYCKQNECAGNGNPRLKLSDLQNKTGASHLFTIEKHGRAAMPDTPEKSGCGCGSGK